MTDYIARYAHSDTDHPAILSLDATNDKDAIAELRRFVEDGHRNGTWANVTLADGRHYGARNEHGRAVGGYVEPARL